MYKVEPNGELMDVHVKEPEENKIETHQFTIRRDELYEVLKETFSKNSGYIVFSNKNGINSDFYEKENFISFFITKVFRTNGHKYVEIFFPLIAVRLSNRQIFLTRTSFAYITLQKLSVAIFPSNIATPLSFNLKKTFIANKTS